MTETTERRPAKLGKSKRWVPKKWDIIYDQMIIMSCLGKTNKEIGETFGYGPQQVCNILNTDRAKESKRILIEHVRATGLTITERLAKLEEASLKNIEHALTDESLRIKSPLAIADRSLAFLKGMGKLEGDKPKEQKATTNIFLGNELASKLIAGIEKANEAYVLHNHNGVEVRQLPSGETKDGKPSGN